MPSAEERAANDEDFANLLHAIAERKRLLLDYLLQERFIQRFRPQHIRDAVFSYIKRGGKSLRPAVTMLACGALGGDEARALPVAAAIEVYHTWTLVHDDVIDKDRRRRGAPTVHAHFAQLARCEFDLPAADAEHYGNTIAMLTGDVQQAWAWSLLFEAHLHGGVAADVILQLAQELASAVTPLLVEGETLDVQYARPGLQLDQAQVIDMLWKKTGVLYEFAGRAGAAIALNDASPDIPALAAMAKFCSLCGTAFQIQDDILGVVGDERQLGKPVGSDIREGKSTLLILRALQRADDQQRARLLRGLGDARAADAAVHDAIAMLRDLGAIDYARDVSRRYVNEALQQLSHLPDNAYKTLLESWALYMVRRDF